MHPWHDAKDFSDVHESRREQAVEDLIPRIKALGDEVDEPGALSRYAYHREVEKQLALAMRSAAAWARQHRQHKVADDLIRTAEKLCNCRLAGPFGLNRDGRTVIAWEQKCGCSKYCPDESRSEAKRLRDRYEATIIEHVNRGGRVYKCWFTLPNYPGERLREGMRHIFKRFRDRLIRAIKKGHNRFGIDGALVILEAPLSCDRDWNIHLNVILLTRGWLDFGAVREHWGGFHCKFREHKDFDDQGMTGLFNEMVKYSTRAMPEKSNDGKHQAPAMIEWQPWELIEWHLANKGFRRTRSYGSLFRVGKPETDFAMPTHWLGRIEFRPPVYAIILRRHNLALHRDLLLDSKHFGLNLIRGDKSTRKTRAHRPTGPP